MSVAMLSAPASNPIFHKTRMCKFHQIGRCARMQDCKFAHSEEELMPQPDFRRTRMCPDFCSSGQCKAGEACAFAHSAQELRADTRRRTRLAALGSAASPETRDEAMTTGGGAAPPEPPAAYDAAAEAPIPVPGLAVPSGLFLAQAACIQLQAVRIMMPHHYGPMPLIEPCVGSEAGGAPSASFQNAFAADLPLEPDCSDKLCGAFSRQSTQEGIEDPHAAFSRQSTTETWVALDEQDCSDQFDDLRLGDSASELVRAGNAGAVGREPSGLGAVMPKQASLIEVANGFGLVCGLRGTFLEFSDVETPRPLLRRARSTGDCLLDPF